jgi:hypothetical protein
MCSDRAGLNSTSSMIDGATPWACESRAAYSRVTHFNRAATIMIFQMSSGLTLPKHMRRG